MLHAILGQYSIVLGIFGRELFNYCHAGNAPVMPNYMNRKLRLSSPLIVTSFPTDMPQEKEPHKLSNPMLPSTHRDLE